MMRCGGYSRVYAASALLLLAAAGPSRAQVAMHGGPTCLEMTPFCVDSSSRYSFEFSANNDKQTTGTSDEFGCLSSHPGEQWMYLTVDAAGTLAMDTSSNRDHDFAVWGPYPSVDAARGSCGRLSTPTSCSYSPSATEHVQISNARPGEVYVYLLTNYARVTQGLTASLSPSNTATVSCQAVDELLQRCADFCSGDGAVSAGSGGTVSSGSSGSFSVVDGPCTTERNGQCVGRSSGYGGNERCTITVDGQITLGSCPIFNTETSFDQLEINGRDYDGNNCPEGIGLTGSSQIHWSSDGSVNGDGWEICVAGSGSGIAPCTDQSRLDAVMRSCCGDSGPSCTLPSSCSRACAVTLPAFVSECAGIVRSMGSQGHDITNLASVCCANSASPACAEISAGSPAPPSAPGGAFAVNSGPCTTSRGGTCVGRPNGYGDNEVCEIVASSSSVLGDCPIFDTESNWDHLTIQGDEYDGNNCPRGVLLDPDTQIEWYSDGSSSGRGWEICVAAGGGH